MSIAGLCAGAELPIAKASTSPGQHPQPGRAMLIDKLSPQKLLLAVRSPSRGLEKIYSECHEGSLSRLFPVTPHQFQVRNAKRKQGT